MEPILWIVYGGVVGALSLWLLSLLMHISVKVFAPQKLHTSWRDPGVIFLSLIFGFMLGGWLGYELAPLSSKDRAWLLADVGIAATIMLVSQYFLRKFWAQPDTQQKFMSALLWELTAFMPMWIYYYGLRHLIRWN